MRNRSLTATGLTLVALLAPAASSAGTASGSVAVGITLWPAGTSSTSATTAPVVPSASTAPVPASAGATSVPAVQDICVSRSLSEETGALVEVACRSGHFVSIAPQPGARFLGVHGGAFRYSIAFGAELGWWLPGEASHAVGRGTVTTLRLYRREVSDAWLDEWYRPLILQVSF